MVSKAEDAIVLYPCPTMGHVVPMVELGKLILRRTPQNCSITMLLSTGMPESPALSSYVLRISKSHPSIRFLRLTDPPLPAASAPHNSSIAVPFEIIRSNAVNVRHALASIAQSANIRAFVIDTFCASAVPVADELGLKVHHFFTSGAALLAFTLHFPLLHDACCGESFREQTDTFLNIPGVSPIRATHMPDGVLDSHSPAYAFMLESAEHLVKSSGIIVNTFECLERDTLKALESRECLPLSVTPPIYSVGPLISDPTEQNTEDEDGKRESRLFSWLDQQPEQSVVFLCFGSSRSLGTFSVPQLREIASGLERSGVRFAWVVKNPFGEQRSFDLEDVLPNGFLQRTEDRGRVIESWAPQADVLRHKAVGGFVTHCGWNSVLEAVVSGVPMVAWPLYAEQRFNRTVMVEAMQIAIGIQEDEKGCVAAEDVEKKVKELMESDKGKLIRDRTMKMKESSVAALTDSGPSTAALMKLLDVWNLHNVVVAV